MQITAFSIIKESKMLFLSWQEEEEMQESILFKNFDLKVQQNKKFKKYFLNLYKDIPYQLILDQMT